MIWYMYENLKFHWAVFTWNLILGVRPTQVLIRSRRWEVGCHLALGAAGVLPLTHSIPQHNPGKQGSLMQHVHLHSCCMAISSPESAPASAVPRRGPALIWNQQEVDNSPLPSSLLFTDNCPWSNIMIRYIGLWLLAASSCYASGP